MDFVCEKMPTLKSLWGAFACIAINSGGQVVTFPHADIMNFAGGFCVIIAFGTYDFKKSAWLQVEVGSKKYSFELPPGVPLFLPSAFVIHGNSKIDSTDPGFRGSMVFWTSGALMRWFLLNGKAVSQLSAAHRKEWEAGMEDRLRAVADMFPKL